jgi:hypothetical protein
VIIIVPPVHYGWPPGYLTHSLSLAQLVRNSWVRSELEQATALYQEGLQLLAQQNDQGLALLQEAVEHDWVVPRLKKVWREKIMTTNGVQVIQLPEIFLGAEFYQFEDYCHPTAVFHDQIAHKIMELHNKKALKKNFFRGLNFFNEKQN